MAKRRQEFNFEVMAKYAKAKFDAIALLNKDIDRDTENLSKVEKLQAAKDKIVAAKGKRQRMMRECQMNGAMLEDYRSQKPSVTLDNWRGNKGDKRPVKGKQKMRKFAFQVQGSLAHKIDKGLIK